MSIKSRLLRNALSAFFCSSFLVYAHAADLTVGDQSYGARTVMEAAGVADGRAIHFVGAAN